MSSRPSKIETEAFLSDDGFKYKYRLADGTTRYRVKEGRKVADLLSVTTISSIGYNEWAESNRKELLEYAADIARQHPEWSISDILDAVSEYEWRRAARGTAMHDAVERYLRGVEVTEADFAEADRKAMWLSWLNWFENRSGLRILALEQPICNIYDGWAGQTDCIARRIRTGETIVVDWKFGKPNPEYRWQLNAYARATHKMTNDGELIPIVSKPTGAVVVATTYNEQEGFASTREVAYRLDDSLYSEFLKKRDILALGLAAWKDQESAAYIDGPTKWKP